MTLWSILATEQHRDIGVLYNQNKENNGDQTIVLRTYCNRMRVSPCFTGWNVILRRKGKKWSNWIKEDFTEPGISGSLKVWLPAFLSLWRLAQRLVRIVGGRWTKNRKMIETSWNILRQPRGYSDTLPFTNYRIDGYQQAYHSSNGAITDL